MTISREPGLPSADTSRLCALVQRAASAAGAVHAIAIRLVSDATMADLHGRFCNDPTTTDVLTFHGMDGESPSLDLILCVDEAVRQAARRGHPMEQELLLYALHGILHCLGHDDHGEAAANAMHAEEDRILEVIGVGRTFARPVREAAP